MGELTVGEFLGITRSKEFKHFDTVTMRKGNLLTRVRIYQQAIEHKEKQGFKQIDFDGWKAKPDKQMVKVEQKLRHEI
jgi:uncharacterized protein YfaS (alpha-2-macroglobulin family)